MWKFLILLLLFSCATQRQIHVTFEPNKNVWLGRSVDEVMLHPEFAVREMLNRKATDGSELITFKNSGGVQSKGGCYTYQGISSCSSSSGEVVCNHLFLIKKGKVADYYRTGQCGEEQLKFRPRDADGDVLLTDGENSQIDIQRSLASEAEKNCSMFAKVLKSQGCNH